MKKIQQKLARLSSISLSVLLSACASNTTWDQGQGVTMAQVYEAQMKENNHSTLQMTRDKVAALPGVMSPITADNRADFQLLPNPTIALYVYPHLVNGNIPVPGYTTQFTLYTQVHYALAGEVPVKAGE